MPTVTITLTDTPTGGVAIHHSFTPAVGQRLSPAEQHALDVIARTHRLFGIDASAGGVTLQRVADTNPGRRTLQHGPASFLMDHKV